MADFQPQSGKQLGELRFEGAWPMAVVFLDGRRLAAGNRDGQIYIWQLPESAEADEKSWAALAPVRRLEGHTNGITQLRVTPDGKWLISASLDRTVSLWETDAPATGTVEVVLDSDARQAEARRSGKKDVLDKPGVQVEVQPSSHLLAGHGDWVQALGLSRDGRRLISGDSSSQAIVWDLAERKEVARWSGHAWNWIVAAALAPDGETALVSEYRYKRDDFDLPAAALRLWKVADGSEKLDLLKIQFPKYDPQATSYSASQVWRSFVAQGLVAADFSPDGQLVAVGQGGETSTGQVHLLESGSGKLLRTIAGHRYGVTDVKFSADGQHLFSSGRDTVVRICQVDDGKEVAQLGKPRGGQFKDWFSALALSPGQQYLAASDIAGLIHVWAFA